MDIFIFFVTLYNLEKVISTTHTQLKFPLSVYDARVSCSLNYDEDHSGKFFT